MMCDVSHLYQAIPTNSCLCMPHHFILLRLNPFDLRVDREGWWFEDFVSQLWVYLSVGGAKNLSWPWLSPLVWLWHLLVNLYIWLIISSCYGSIPLTLELIRRDGGLNTLCHSSEFSCQLRVLKTFPDPIYLRWSGYGTYW